MKSTPEGSYWNSMCVCCVALVGLGILIVVGSAYAQIVSRRQAILVEQERRAQEYANDPKVLQKLIDKYPSHSRNVLELLLKGSWLCINNGGYPGTDVGAPSRELKAVANDMGIDYIKRAIQLDSNFPQLYLALGEYLKMKSIQLSNHDFRAESETARKEALESYQKAVQLDPTSPEAYFGIARTTPISDFDEQIRNLLTVKKLDPSYQNVHAFLAVSYEMKGDLEKASDEVIESMNGPGNPGEILDHLQRIVQKSQHYSWLLRGYLAYLERWGTPWNYDRVLFAISPYRAKTLKEAPSLNLESLVDHRELADFLVKVGTIAAQKQQAWLGSPLHQWYKRSAERDSSLAGVRPPQDLSGIAEQYFKKALELDPTKAEEIRKIAEASQLDELKKFARELPR